MSVNSNSYPFDYLGEGVGEGEGCGFAFLHAKNKSCVVLQLGFGDFNDLKYICSMTSRRLV